MLVLTQLGVGLAVAAAVVTYYVTNLPGGVRWFLPVLAWVATAAGLVASVAHLGQPLRAWRVFLGLRKSWLSREAVLLGIYFALLSGAVVLSTPAWWAITAATGLVAVFCSIMIYVDTRRSFWRLVPSSVRMGGTVAVAALTFTGPVLGASVLALKLGFEALALRGVGSPARLQRGPLRKVVIVRYALGTMAAGLLAAGLPVVALGVWLLGELAERHLYFRAVDAPKMPGMPASS